MAGLVPAISIHVARPCHTYRDCRDEPGNDDKLHRPARVTTCEKPMAYRGMLAETVPFRGHNGDVGEAYYARAAGAGGPLPGVVVIHHMPGWDEWITEAMRKLAHHGYAAVAPHLYFREGPGSPDDVGARVRAA